MYEKITLFGLYSSMVVTILKTLLISLRRRALDIKNIEKKPNLKCKLYMIECCNNVVPYTLWQKQTHVKQNLFKLPIIFQFSPQIYP